MKKEKKSLPTKKKSSIVQSAPEDYASTISFLKKQIEESQIKAVVSANTELIKLYWKIGETIVERQEKGGWGASIVERLAKDLQSTFPGMEGFSRTNVFRMRAFYIENKFVPQAVGQLDLSSHLGIFGQIPWGHNMQHRQN